MRYCSVATQQQSCQGSSASRRSYFAHFGCHVGLSRGEAHGTFGSGALRVSRRRISRGSRFDPWGAQVDRQRYRSVELSFDSNLNATVANAMDYTYLVIVSRSLAVNHD